jgi:uncharacterized protein (TIGR03086 family)
MQPHSLVAAAAAPVIETVRGITPDQLDAQTPCTEYDVRGLLNHLLFWGPSLEGAGRKEAVPPPAGSDRDVQLVGTDWAAQLEVRIDRIVAAWSDPRAWEGMTRLVGPTETPADMIGGMVLGELVVHGWDLTRATGGHPQWHDDVLEFTHDMVAKTAEQGREMGVYGPEVPVPETAPLLDRILGLTGRDPRWTA